MARGACRAAWPLAVEPGVDVALAKTPLPADPYRGNLAGLDEAVDGAKVDLEVFQDLLCRQKRFVNHACPSPLPRFHWTRSPSPPPSVSDRRQLDREDRPAVRVIRGGDVAAVFLHDAVNDRQPETRALPDFLRRVEGFENPRQRVLRDTIPGVAHRRDDAANRHVEGGRELDPSRTAFRGNRLLGVHHDVQKHLVQQQWIALHAGQFLVIVSHDFDVECATGGHSQCQHFLQDGREADRRDSPDDASRRRPEGSGRFSRPDPLRGRSSASRASTVSETLRWRAAARGGRARPAAGCSARARCRPRTARAPPVFPTGSAVFSIPRVRPRACDCGVRSRATRTRPTRSRS